MNYAQFKHSYEHYLSHQKEPSDRYNSTATPLTNSRLWIILENRYDLRRQVFGKAKKLPRVTQ